MADEFGRGKTEGAHHFQPACGDLLFRHFIGQKTVPLPVHEVLRELAAVIDLKTEGMARRKERAHIFARVAEGEVAHKVFAVCKLLLADALFVFVASGACDEHQPVRRKPPAHIPRLFEGKVGERDVERAVLQHLQQVCGVPEHDFERGVPFAAEKIAQERVQPALVHGVDGADAQRALVAGGGVHLADKALLKVADALGVALKEHPLFGQLHAALPAHEQFFARFRLQLRNAVGDGGLRHIQALRRARKIFQFGKHQKGAYGLAVHRPLLCRAARSHSKNE